MTKPPRPPEQAPETPGPPVDLTREGEFLVLTASLPGVKPADLRVSVVGDRQVYLEGIAHYRHPVPRESLVLAERTYGPFARTVTLPLPVRSGGARVRFEQGVLTVHLPLRLEAVPLQWAGQGGVRRG